VDFGAAVRNLKRGSEVTDDLFAVSPQKRQMNARLRAAPVVVVEGVMGDQVITSGPQRSWIEDTTLDVWRFQGGELNTRPLCLTRKLDDAAMKHHDHEGPRYYDLVRVRARLVMEPDAGGPRGWLEGPLEVIGDEELAGHAARLRLPVIHQDPLFGPCTRDRHNRTFTAQASWNGSRIEVEFHARTLEELPPLLEQARRMWQDQARWHRDVVDCAADELVELKNERLDEGEEPLAVDAFKQRIRLQSIRIWRGGWFDLCFSDDGLFWGDAVVVAGTVEDGVKDACLERQGPDLL